MFWRADFFPFLDVNASVTSRGKEKSLVFVSAVLQSFDDFLSLISGFYIVMGVAELGIFLVWNCCVSETLDLVERMNLLAYYNRVEFCIACFRCLAAHVCCLMRTFIIMVFWLSLKQIRTFMGSLDCCWWSLWDIWSALGLSLLTMMPCFMHFGVCDQTE